MCLAFGLTKRLIILAFYLKQTHVLSQPINYNRTLIMFNALKYTNEDRLATIVLNRPNDANGLTLEMATELAEAAKLVSSDDSVKAVVITGEGRFFCAGGDVASMYHADNSGEAVKAIADALHDAIEIFATMDAPVICAVNGVAAGAGFSMAVMGDLVIAADSAKFTMAYSNIALSPDGSSTYYLPRLVGLRKAQELMYTNRVLSAEEALDWNLINYVVPADDLASKIEEVTGMFLKGSRQSNASIKKLLISSETNSLHDQMMLESQTISDCANGDDGKEGVASFIEKRKPTFS